MAILNHGGLQEGVRELVALLGGQTLNERPSCLLTSRPKELNAPQLVVTTLTQL